MYSINLIAACLLEETFETWFFKSLILTVTLFRVTETLEALTGPVEKDLKDFARLAKWEDRNHYSLAASADKAHRKLHKFMRKYSVSDFFLDFLYYL